MIESEALIGGRVRSEDVIVLDPDKDGGFVDFSGLLLSSPILSGLTEAGFERPSPIQLKAIPLGRFGTDLVAQAKSGTGKTCVFTVIVLENLSLDNRQPQALLIAPTREIALQIVHVIRTIGKFLPGLSVHAAIGGIPVASDRKAFRKGVHIVVGTPGRIKSLLELKILPASSLRLLVLDEADQLLDDAFFHQIESIFSSDQIPGRRQVMLFSATYTHAAQPRIQSLVSRNAQHVLLSADKPSLAGVKQFVIEIDPPHSFTQKLESLLSLLASLPFHQCVVFSNSPSSAEDVVAALEDVGYPSVCISGAMEQSDRENAIARIRRFQARVLVSTDLTARGIDIERVTLVINIDLPRDAATYIHRVGRTGRFGTKGVAVTIVYSGKERSKLSSICRKLKTKVQPFPFGSTEDLFVSEELSSAQKTAFEELESRRRDKTVSDDEAIQRFQERRDRATATPVSANVQNESDVIDSDRYGVSDAYPQTDYMETPIDYDYYHSKAHRTLPEVDRRFYRSVDEAGVFPLAHFRRISPMWMFPETSYFTR